MQIAADRAARVVDALLADLAALGVGVVIGSGDGTILDANDTFCQLIGYTIAELQALPHFGAFVAPEERAGIAVRRAQRLRHPSAGEDEPLIYESVLIGPNGKRVPIESAVLTIEVGDATIDVWVVQDLRLVLDQADELDQLRNLVERMPVGVVIWDASGVDDPADLRLVRANAAASEALGIDLAGRVGWRMVEAFPAMHSNDTGLRVLALKGTGGAEDLGEVVYGDADSPEAVYHRLAVSLPDDTVALLLENVSAARAEEIRRRQLLERLVDVGDQERRQLAMGVHDDPVQQLAAAKVMVESLRRRPDAGDGRMADVETALTAAMRSLRRLVFELSPPELTESGLESAIRSAAQYLFDDSSEQVTVDISLRREPSPTVQTAAFRIVTEALTNARRHAHAGRVAVSVSEEGRGLRVEISDDGKGFITGAVPGHIGLRNMRERATALGGEFHITSDAEGTTINALVPFEARLDLHREPATSILADPAAPTAGEVEALRRERDSLLVTAAESLVRAQRAEARIRDALAFAQIVLRPGLERHEIVTLAAPLIGRQLGDACTVRLLSPDRRFLEPAASWHVDEAKFETFNEILFRQRPTEDWHTGTAVAGGHPVMIDLKVTPWDPADGPDPSAEPYNLRWAVVAPLRIADQTFGTLTVMRERTGRAYDDRDVDFAQSLADGVSLALIIESRRPR